MDLYWEFWVFVCLIVLNRNQHGMRINLMQRTIVKCVKIGVNSLSFETGKLVCALLSLELALFCMMNLFLWAIYNWEFTFSETKQKFHSASSSDISFDQNDHSRLCFCFFVIFGMIYFALIFLVKSCKSSFFCFVCFVLNFTVITMCKDCARIDNVWTIRFCFIQDCWYVLAYLKDDKKCFGHLLIYKKIDAKKQLFIFLQYFRL